MKTQLVMVFAVIATGLSEELQENNCQPGIPYECTSTHELRFCDSGDTTSCSTLMGFGDHCYSGASTPMLACLPRLECLSSGNFSLHNIGIKVCDVFYQCSMTPSNFYKATLHECPEGMLFSSSLSSCTSAPDTAECKTSADLAKGIILPNRLTRFPVLSAISSVFPFRRQNISIVTKDVCKEGETIASHIECKDYKKCVGGVWTPQSCLRQYYDPVTQRCVDDFSVCSESPLAVGYSTVCSLGDKRANVSDCRKFMICIQPGIWSPRSCNASFYDQMTGQCVNTSLVCGPTTPGIQFNDLIECKLGEKRHVQSDCRKFEICHEPGIWIPLHCGNNFYDITTQQCVISSNICDSRVVPCTVGTYETDTEDCHKYKICVEPGIWTSQSCAANYFDDKNSRCVSNPNVCTSNTAKPIQVTSAATSIPPAKLPNIATSILPAKLPNISTSISPVKLPNTATSITPAILTNAATTTRRTPATPVNTLSTTTIRSLIPTIPRDVAHCTIGRMKPVESNCHDYTACEWPGVWKQWSCGVFLFDTVSNTCVCNKKVCGTRSYSSSNLAFCFIETTKSSTKLP